MSCRTGGEYEIHHPNMTITRLQNRKWVRPITALTFYPLPPPPPPPPHTHTHISGREGREDVQNFLCVCVCVCVRVCFTFTIYTTTGGDRKLEASRLMPTAHSGDVPHTTLVG